MNHPAATTSEATESARIPVLDVGPYLAGEPGAAAHLAAAIKQTCEDTGFLVIATHGIPQDLNDRALPAAADFFAHSDEQKPALKLQAHTLG